MSKNISKNKVSFHSEKEIRYAKFDTICDMLYDEEPSQFTGMISGIIMAHLTAHNVPAKAFVSILAAIFDAFAISTNMNVAECCDRFVSILMEHHGPELIQYMEESGMID